MESDEGGQANAAANASAAESAYIPTSQVLNMAASPTRRDDADKFQEHIGSCVVATTQLR
jgi:hypothetical protein